MTMTDTAAHASIGAAARELHLPTIRAEAARLAEIAIRERQSYLCFLAEALAAEVDERASRRRSRRITEARFPRLKRLADFDTTAAPTIQPAQLAALACGAYLDAGEPIVLLGDSGTGKSHLSRRTLRPPRPLTTRRTRLHPNRPTRRRAAIPNHHRTRRTSKHRNSNQSTLQRMGNRLPRPPPRRRHRRPRHLQRTHPRNRHPVLPTPHQQNHHPPQTDQLTPPSATPLKATDDQPA
jgi:hypothetical protein